MSVDPVKPFLDAAIPPLSREEEAELLTRRNEPEARERLICSCIPFVIRVASRYVNRGLDIEDLIAHGLDGLNHAITKHDGGANRLLTYAGHWVLQKVTRAVQDHSRTIRYPVHLQNGKTDLRALPAVVASIDEPLYPWDPESGDVTIAEMAADPSPSIEVLLDAQQRAEKVRRLLGHLDERSRAVLTLRYDNPPAKQKAIAELLGVSAERVRQIEESALRKLRSAPVAV